MYTKSKIFAVILTAALSLSFLTSCDTKVEGEDVNEVSSGVYVLNQGKFKSNNASITYFDFKTEFPSGDIFLDKNNRGLGDTGQDMIRYGSKIYVAVYNSKLIEVMDLKAKSIKTVPLKDEANNARSPRTLNAANGKVYIVLYDGYVASMDTTTLSIDKKTVKVGDNPDGSVISNNKLYVANSGGMAVEKGKTISVIDLAKFEEVKKITVNMNPTAVDADKQGNIYVKSEGNYGDVPGKFQRISNDEVVTDIDVKNVKGFEIADNKAYIYTFEYDEKWQAANKKIVVYDVAANKIVSENLVKDETIEKTPYCINIDPKTKDIYLGVTDYVNNGKMYCFNQNGVLKYKFTVGVSPCKVVFNY